MFILYSTLQTQILKLQLTANMQIQSRLRLDDQSVNHKSKLIQSALLLPNDSPHVLNVINSMDFVQALHLLHVQQQKNTPPFQLYLQLVNYYHSPFKPSQISRLLSKTFFLTGICRNSEEVSLSSS